MGGEGNDRAGSGQGSAVPWFVNQNSFETKNVSKESLDAGTGVRGIRIGTTGGPHKKRQEKNTLLANKEAPTSSTRKIWEKKQTSGGQHSPGRAGNPGGFRAEEYDRWPDVASRNQTPNLNPHQQLGKGERHLAEQKKLLGELNNLQERPPNSVIGKGDNGTIDGGAMNR